MNCNSPEDCSSLYLTAKEAVYQQSRVGPLLHYQLLPVNHSAIYTTLL